MSNNIQLVRVLGGGLRLSTVRGVYLDAEGEEVGAVVDCVEFSPDGQVQVIRDCLEGEATDTFRPVEAE